MTLTLRYMALPDIHDVAAIDAQSFTPPWSVTAYQFEVSESNYSHMLVLEDGGEAVRGTWIERLLNAVGMGSPPRGRILGYGGLWYIAGEAHISTIAIDPEMRGKKYGALLLAAMCVRGIRLRASYVILEVRVSNTVAQALYHDFGFTITGTKPRYYQSDGEDAYAMRLSLTPETSAQIEERFAGLLSLLSASDRFTMEFPIRKK